MTTALVVRPSVSRDIAEARAYHSQHGREAAFMSAVDQVFAGIAERPRMYPLAYGDVRRALLRRNGTRWPSQGRRIRVRRLPM